jgi:hypothetical protein
MCSALTTPAPSDERLRLINTVIKPGFATARVIPVSTPRFGQSHQKVQIGASTSTAPSSATEYPDL